MQPLHDILVLDFSQNLPGPYATLQLAAMGATVIKVEPPRGDPARNIRPFFDLVNRGKHSVVLNLKTEEGRREALALAERADILVEGFRPGVMERLGLGPTLTMAENPSLIYLSISAWGQTGPLHKHPAHDLNCQALSGLADIEAGQGAALPIADLSTSQAAVTSVLAALMTRQQTGKGTHLDLAMTDAALSFAEVWGEGVDFGRSATSLPGRLRRRLSDLRLKALPHYDCFTTLDGRQLAVGIVDETHFWSRLCAKLGFPETLGSLTFPVRLALGPVLKPLVAARLRTRTASAWLEHFADADIPVCAVPDVSSAKHHPQFLARNRLDTGGRVRPAVPGLSTLPAFAPELGSHQATDFLPPKQA